MGYTNYFVVFWQTNLLIFYNCLIMSGEEVKKIIKNEGFTLSEIANLLGYDNDQRLHSALKSQDIKTGLVEEIARVTNISVCRFFGVADQNISSIKGDNNTSVAGNGNKVNSGGTDIDKLIGEISAQRKMFERSQDQIDQLIKFITEKR